jgi:hypothetical protein
MSRKPSAVLKGLVNRDHRLREYDVYAENADDLDEKYHLIVLHDGYEWFSHDGQCQSFLTVSDAVTEIKKWIHRT